VQLGGSAYCDNCPAGDVAFGYCPAIQTGLSTNISVDWTNRTTGATGRAFNGIYGSCSCLFSYCFTSYSNRWMAYEVALDAVGDNAIEVRAHDASGNSALDSVTITRLPVTGLDVPEGISIDTANNEIHVASTLNSALITYTRTDIGNAMPKRIVSGASTGLVSPSGIAMDIYSEMLALNSYSITTHALTANGDVPPVRSIAGASTGLAIPQGMVVDASNNEIFVTNYGDTSITAYALTASGNASPIRTIRGIPTGLASPMGIAVDTVNNEIFVTNLRNTGSGLEYFITVYERTANGDATPLRTVIGASTGLDYPAGIVVDTVNNEILATNYFNSTITVYARTANGNVSPVRTIAGASTGLASPWGIAVDTVNNEIFVTMGLSSILVFQRTASGNTAPLRTINNPTSGL
jgi:DNA-binding beta-propeller fold protein YncE